MLQRFAGSGVTGTTGDGGDALSARIDTVRFVAVGPDGSLYLSTHNGGNSTPSTVRQVDARGKIHRIAGTGATGFSGENQPASESKLFQPNGIATDPDGNLYVTDSVNQRVRRVGQALPEGFQQSDILIPSADGSEVYRFSDQGRHLSTVDALTGGVRYEFGYDAEGLLHEVRDAAGNVTTIEHDGAGRPTAIVSPYGQQTTLDVDANGYLSSVSRPGGPTDVFTYSADGLMLTRTDPRQKLYEFEHDALGRLVRDEDPAGGYQALSRTDDGDAYEVVRQTAEGRSTRYRVERQADGSERRVVTRPDGTASERTTRRSGSWSATDATGQAQSATLAGVARATEWPLGIG